MVRTLARGQTFAGYRIERLLGVGGMGEVYLAQDRDLPRPVALKLLGAAVADDPEVRERFLREADTAARLSHPNIVAVYARGRDEHRLWMAMQYVEGTDVAAVLREGPLRPDHAVRIIGETAKALDHAHRAGVLHRDVKPANILLAWGPHQQVYLADFGIAKALDHTSGLTRTGEMYASFQYAAPEQFDFGPVDHRADVYALGCTLFHMLTGELPYPGASTAQVINGHLNMPVPRPSLRHPAVPTAFDEVVAHALAKDPDRRYGSCGELADAAQRALTGAHGAAPRHPVPNPAPTQPSAEFAASSNTYAPTAFAPRHTGPVAARSRRPRPALLLGALLALLVAFGGGGIRHRRTDFHLRCGERARRGRHRRHPRRRRTGRLRLREAHDDLRLRHPVRLGDQGVRGRDRHLESPGGTAAPGLAPDHGGRSGEDPRGRCPLHGHLR
ncbi:Serine/threonine-protein kinase pknF [Nocardia otitidiscaviarum]|uniref:non-specific serine/threonine protein kinase n=1 Tax=Nocardia otitidiscaviarum TaxID=1823 RepID=A0A379JKF4_9NOCA|nr:serine/threonine-protein kinase [Nocardia otitidiscaviarum]SUD49139.1 Serine/threonine-protein kinase pknF [Nocardia otitidiscaviarum]